MKAKKLVALTMTLAMTMSMLVGCTSSSTNTDSSSTTTESTSSTTAESSTEEVEETSKEFSLWMTLHSTTAKFYTTLNEHPGAALIAEATGITAVYEHPPVEQDETQFNLLMAKPDTLPDAMRYYFQTTYDGGVAGGIEDGVLIDITTLVEENAPNFMAYLGTSEDVRREAYNDEGQLIMFGATIADEGMAGRCFNGLMINKTYLDMTGLDAPVTIDDWTEMLYAFKDLGITPFTFGCNNTFVENGLNNAFASAYGTTAGARYMDVDGIATFGPLEDGYKDWIELFRMWYSEGLLDPDFLSKTVAEVRTEFESGTVAATENHANALINLPVTSAQLGEAYEGIGVAYPVVNEGDTIQLRHAISVFNESHVVITTQAEDPIDIINYFDYLYSEEGIIDSYWGTEGTDYNDTDNSYYINEEGVIEDTALVKENPDGVSEADARRAYTFRDMNVVWPWEYQQSSWVKVEDAMEAWELANTDYNMSTALYLTAAEDNEYNDIMTDVETYVNEMTAKFIMGIESMDNYDAFIETIYSMGIEDATAIQQAALDRYYAR